jgi:hypothetical protein
MAVLSLCVIQEASPVADFRRLPLFNTKGSLPSVESVFRLP